MGTQMPTELRTIAGLNHAPARITGSWVTKTVTTDPPRYVPHLEYALCFQVVSEEELLLVPMLLEDGQGQFAKTWRSKAKRESEFRVSFFPSDWRHSDKVHVHFGYSATCVEHRALKHDPRSLVRTDWLGSHSITSGSILTVASIDAGQRIEWRVFVVTKSDTVAKRGRWALKPSLAAELPKEMRFVLNGTTSGTF